MSNHIFLNSRRKFLKTAAYTAALSVGGVSSLAFANEDAVVKSQKLPTVTLFNQYDKTIYLDAGMPIELEKANGLVVVKLNQVLVLNSTADTQHTISLSAGQRLSFPVSDELAPLLKGNSDSLIITSEFNAFDNMVPISSYDSLVA